MTKDLCAALSCGSNKSSGCEIVRERLSSLPPFPTVILPTRLCAVLSLLAAASSATSAVTVQELADRVRVSINGELFTELRHGDASHVYYYPLLGPGSVSMTRSWPMDAPPDEEHDHPHHRSMWFSHGTVNGIDFWTEAATHGDKESKMPVGKIVLDKILTAEGGAASGVVSAALKWVAPDGSVPLTSVQTLRVVSAAATERIFDFETTLKAGEKDVVFGDTKEGTFAIRIAESMRLKGPKNTPGQGHILNSEGREG